MKIIQITISPSGETTVETKGYEGSTCRDGSAILERALGQTTGEQLKSEFYSVPCQSQPIREGT
jgi:hypothetical protein